MITSQQKSYTLWQIAERVVWGETIEAEEGDLSFLALINALRAQLELGRKIASLEAAGVPEERWSEFLPRIWPKILEKRRSQVKKLGARYFERGMELLLDLEELSRQGSSQDRALLDRFRIALRIPK